MEDKILETERLYLRRLARTDYEALSWILQDEETMYAYNGAFSDEETKDWMERQLKRYEEYGSFGFWAVILKETGEMIGQCGLTLQNWKERKILEIGYLFRKQYWHKGYAAEAAKACKEYAFTKLKAEEVFSMIRETNTASRRVAEKNGMAVVDTWVKQYRGAEMPHLLYSVKKNTKNGLQNM
ncbi:MAG: GNAT family N-acetyltransferase [Lachnospiraceae bacterium]|nr:GNAT family N-acetyltransferase [Lachnospiraceae bacterium]